MTVSAKVICDSKFGSTRLITLEIELHRFILPEFNTHRTLSRNFQSSRAVPIKNMIDQVRNDPAMPIHWGKNQPGMVADNELDVLEKEGAKLQWKEAAKKAANMAESLSSMGVHKQVVNRLLEPFMWTKGVVTGTYEALQAFLKLRAHKDAQPEIQALAFKIKEAIEVSVPVELKEGEWHLPYVTSDVISIGGVDKTIYLSSEDSQLCDNMSIEDAIKVSTSCAAQVSYRRLDDSLDKALKIYDMLNLPCNGVHPENPPHFSPTEHVAVASVQMSTMYSGNFNTKDFVQYRKLLEEGEESGWIK